MSKNKHKYLNDLGIKSDDPCIFNTTELKNGKITNRTEHFRKQRQKYGFDERETWSLDLTMIGWIYSHLKLYKEIGGRMIDLSFHSFDIPVLHELPESQYETIGETSLVKAYTSETIESHTQDECIDIACSYFEFWLRSSTSFDIKNTPEEFTKLENMSYEYARCGMKIVAEILPALWW